MTSTLKRKLTELMEKDPTIVILENAPVPAIVTKGRRLVYQNPAAVRACLFSDGSRHCYTPYRIEIGKIKVENGHTACFSLPTAQGYRYAVAYGREDDTVILFPLYAYDMVELFSFNSDIAQDICTHTVEAFLGGKSFDGYCRSLCEKLCYFEAMTTHRVFDLLTDQLVYRLTRQQIYEHSDKYEGICVRTDEMLSALSALAETIMTCRVSLVQGRILNDHIEISVDGVECARLAYSLPQLKAGKAFWTTERELVTTTAMAFAAELYFGDEMNY